MMEVASSGTNSPTFKLPNHVEISPTSQGRVAPPKPASANMTLAMREELAPNSLDSMAMVIG